MKTCNNAKIWLRFETNDGFLNRLKLHVTYDAAYYKLGCALWVYYSAIAYDGENFFLPLLGFELGSGTRPRPIANAPMRQCRCAVSYNKSCTVRKLDSWKAWSKTFFPVKHCADSRSSKVVQVRRGTAAKYRRWESAPALDNLRITQGSVRSQVRSCVASSPFRFRSSKPMYRCRSARRMSNGQLRENCPQPGGGGISPFCTREMTAVLQAQGLKACKTHPDYRPSPNSVPPFTGGTIPRRRRGGGDRCPFPL